jgi:hypothetical protein
MSIRLEMLQVARLGPKLLGDSAGLVEKFLRSQLNGDGGFKDRTGKSDLYYSVFGLEGLLALQAELPATSIENYLGRFQNGQNLDFVHLCCLARCRAALRNFGGPVELKILSRLEHHRTTNGGYNQIPGNPNGTVYAAFLALAAYQDLQSKIPEPLALVQSLKFLETNDGAWTNERLGHPQLTGSTNATAAAITLLRNLEMPINPQAADWLLARAHPQGGFLAAPNAPIPDLLSTATALHALSGMQCDFSKVRERTLDFIDSLWTNEGGFFGHWSDEHLDCEYTYYGLLALGHLSL